VPIFCATLYTCERTTAARMEMVAAAMHYGLVSNVHL